MIHTVEGVPCKQPGYRPVRHGAHVGGNRGLTTSVVPEPDFVQDSLKSTLARSCVVPSSVIATWVAEFMGAVPFARRETGGTKSNYQKEAN